MEAVEKLLILYVDRVDPTGKPDFHKVLSNESHSALGKLWLFRFDSILPSNWDLRPRLCSS